MIESRNNNIDIRQGNKEQVEQYLNILGQTLEEQKIPELYIEKKKSSLKKEIQSEETVFFFVKVDKKLVGYMQLNCGDLPTNRHIGNIKMDTLNSFRFVELQRRMLMSLEAYAYLENLKRLQLIVPYDFQMVNINVSLGYRIEGKLKNYYRVKKEFFSGYLMAKML